MRAAISLVMFNAKKPMHWDFGKVYAIGYTTTSLLDVRNEILQDASEYILFWDLELGDVPSESIDEITKSSGDLWHLGPRLGTQNAIELLDFIQPTNMLHLNVDTSINHSSWKHSFRGSLMKFEVFKQTKLSAYSNSLDLMGLDFGYKAMKSGVITRYANLLKVKDNFASSMSLEKREQLLFIRNNFDAKAFFWTYLMSFFKISPLVFYNTYKSKDEHRSVIYKQKVNDMEVLDGKNDSVSIVIATLERYPFLKNELEELRLLEIPVREIIIIDQTPKAHRSRSFLKGFSDLPIVYIETDKLGQCSARNRGIEAATSKFIWFLDDDMKEIPPNYLEKHLSTIYALNADVSCGIPDEIGTDFIDRSISKIELAEGFPTNDVLVKRALLLAVNGFDVKMDQKQSEDQEIGLRLLKNGALSVKNNQLRIVHLRASRGGLRKHNVRKITFSSSRNSLFQRRFLHHSEIYLNLKHFTKEQVKKLVLLNIRGTFIVKGSFFKKSIKIILGALLILHSISTIYVSIKRAQRMINYK